MKVKIWEEMYSSSSCKRSREDYVHYEIDVNCPGYGRVGEIKVSRSRDNPGRIFYKCTQCGKFIKWAMPVEQLRDIKRVLKVLNARVLVLITVLIVIAVMIDIAIMWKIWLCISYVVE